MSLIVYKVTNLINGKVYIGQTSQSLRARKLAHLGRARRGDLHPFYCSIRKYGQRYFRFKIMHHATSYRHLNKLEELAIKRYKATNRRYGYNIVEGPTLGISFKHSKETRLKISKALKGRKLSKEHRTRISSSRKGATLSARTIKRISKALIGNKYGKGNIGIKRSKATLERMSKSIHAYWEGAQGEKRSRLSKSGFRGVSWNKQRERWEARLLIKGKLVYLGSFRDKVQAAKTVRTALKKHFKQAK